MPGNDAAPDWWESFFTGLAVEFWKVAVPDEATRADADFLWRRLSLGPGARVLDVPCGDGRLTVPLARRGATMTGVDISPEFLAAAARDAANSSVVIRWRQSEMRNLPWTSEFDAAFCFGNSFGFLDDSGDADFLAAVSRALLPGGRFAIDYGQSAESVFPRIEPRVEGEIGGIGFVEETRYEPLTGRVENRYEFSRGARREIKLASQRVYTVRELVRMLERAGFHVASVFGSTNEQSFGLGSPRLIVVADRR